jgi:hypothetical protein
MLVACYIQHEGGCNEYQAVIDTLNENNIKYTIENEFEGKEILIIIKKKMAE